MSHTVLLAGGTGLIGTRLAVMLEKKGYRVIFLTRDKKKAAHPPYYYWDTALLKMDSEAIKQADFVVNLAGEGIMNESWTERRKKELIESRTKAADTIKDALLFSGKQLSGYISASAIGIYGITDDVAATEETLPPPMAQDDFLSQCCILWEQAAGSISALDIRTVVLRIGVVLTLNGGALAELAKPLSYGLGTYFGDGKAWYSWIHIDDICNMIVFAIENKQVSGVYNAVAPTPVSNKDLAIDCKKVSNQMALMLPVPSFAIRLAFGERAALVLNSVLVSSQKIQDAGFQFQFPTIEPALADLFAKKKDLVS